MIADVLTAVRYLQPFRQGGSVPALVEADDGELYVLKFHAAAQGRLALVAELAAGEIGRRLGLRVPELAFIQVAPDFGMGEAHPEIRDLLNASAGLNLGLRFLPDSLEYNPLLKPPPLRPSRLPPGNPLRNSRPGRSANFPPSPRLAT